MQNSYSSKEVQKVLKENFIICPCENGNSDIMAGGMKMDLNDFSTPHLLPCQRCEGKSLILPEKDMKISLIAAMSENRIIGVDGELPWHISEDLKHFRRKTSGKTVIMGRKTYESIGRLLPKRKNIIVTRDKEYHNKQGEKIKDAVITHSLQDALNTCSMTEEIMIIGGGEIYKQSLSFSNKIYLTEVHTEIEGDVRFPELSERWKVISEKFNEGDPSFTFKTYEKIV